MNSRTLNLLIMTLNLAVTSAVWVAIGQFKSKMRAPAFANPPAASAGIPSDDAHRTWLTERQKGISLAEQGSQALQSARLRVSGIQLKIPRDAAICLDARQQIDADLKAAMQPGKEFGLELSQWHERNRAVDLFCDYALSIGGLR